MRVTSLIVYGLFLGAIWNIKNVVSVILTTTLITGFMGGFLMGRMNLGTFLDVLSTNMSALPTINLPSLVQREENKATPNTNNVPVIPAFMPQWIVPPTIATVLAYKDVPSYYYYGNGAVMTGSQMVANPLLMQTPTATSTQIPSSVPALPSQQGQSSSSSTVDFSIFPIKPADVPLSLDSKIRERFIRQLALMDPLNCLPKLFCEVSADPYGTALALDHGTIAAIQPSATNQKISLKEMEAYEIHLHKQTSTTSTKATTTTPKPTSETPANDEEEDDESASSEESESEQDDSFEQYRKEHEHKVEMQALEELIDETDDPETYTFILKDKQRKKDAMKKYRDKHKKNENDELVDEEALASFRQEEVPFSEGSVGYPQNHHHVAYDDPTLYLNRRLGSEPIPPLPPPEPPRPPLFMSSMIYRTTEAPLRDMFSDDPFFDDFTSGGSGRSARQFLYQGTNRRPGQKNGRNVEKDLMKTYRVAYKVAEKYRSPEMCKVAFPSCPYQTKTIMNVVNRLETGLLPFDLKKGQVYQQQGGSNNINQFKNTLLAIERLNKATLQAQARGEPLDLEKLMEVASSPTVNIDANTSKNIVKEFQQVVSKIKTAKLKKLKSRKKKKKNKKRKNYDAVHYYKKAQMEKLKPKEQAIPKNPLDPYRSKAEDDETQIPRRRKWEQVPTFKETYVNMFKKVPTPKPKPTFPTTKVPAILTSRRKATMQTSTGTSKPVWKFSEFDEDDEKDARVSEEAINARISQRKVNRSPIV